MVNSTPGNGLSPVKTTPGFVRFCRKIYHPLGFKKGYNFPFFVILVGALMGFVLARLQFLDVNGRFFPQVSPSELYWYTSKNVRRIGIIVHLACILPAGFLVCFQFVPVIRHKLTMFHRINGYIIILLLLVSNAGIFMIARHVAGGSPHTQAMVGALSTITTISISLAYYNIKRLQIDQHRAWMLRTWVYCGSIISLRFVLMAAMDISYKMDDLYEAQLCSQIYYGYAVYGVPAAENPTSLMYPQCGENPSGSSAYASVPTDPSTPEGVSAAYHLTFGMSAFIALLIHAISVEVYLHLTPAETERLRLISKQRQEDAKFKNPRYEGPGYEGLTAARLGDTGK